MLHNQLSSQLRGSLVTRKTFVIDTNVLLHDPQAMMSFRDSEVVIPLPVLEELDSMKRQSDEIGNNARSALRTLDRLTREHSGDYLHGVTLPNGALLRLEGETAPKIKEFPLPLSRFANQILQITLSLKKNNDKIVLVSKDLVMRVKSEALGIIAQDYENYKFSYRHLYRGYRELEVEKKQIDLLLKDGSLPCDDLNLHPNEFCYLSCPEHSSAITVCDPKTRRLVQIEQPERDIWGVEPLNPQQSCALDLLLRDEVKLITLVGQAGTGKTLLALATGLQKVFDEGSYSRILVSRPIIPLGKDIGYLPGSKEEKLYHWMQPIYDNLEFLCQSSNGPANGSETQKWIMESKKIEMEAVTYIRGRTLPKIYIIIDEAQNLTPHEVKTVISRAGKGTKVILTGDPTQIDNPYLDRDSNAMTYVIGKFAGQPIFGNVFLDKTERSELAALAADIL